MVLPGGRVVSPVEKRLEAIESILRQRELPADGLADLIIEARQLGQRLGHSEKRMKVLDLFLAKSKPETVKFIVNDLRDKLKHPEKTPVDRAIEDIARQSGQDVAEVRALMEKMSKLSPEQRVALCKAAMENPNLQQISFEVKGGES